MRPLATAFAPAHLASLALAACCAIAATPGCTDAVPDGGEDDELVGPAAPDADLDRETKADAAPSELRVRMGELTLWFDVRARADREGPTGHRIVIEGRASRNLVSVRSWVPDDLFGEAEIVSARRFTITLDEPHELQTILSGAPLYLSVQTATGTPRDYYARIALEPRFMRFTGSRDVWVRDAVLPVYVRDGRSDLTYRALVTTTSAPTALTATAGDVAPRVTPAADDGTAFALDLGGDALVAVLTGREPMRFTAQWGIASLGGAAPRTARKEATLAATVVKVAMSIDDPYNGLVLDRVCADTTHACIAAANGADDLGACGTYRDVAICVARGAICGEDSPDLELFPIAAPELGAELARFDAACGTDGTACGLDDVTFFRLPACLEGTPDLAGLVAMLSNMDEYRLDGWSGGPAARADLLASGLFAGDAGVGLFGTLDAWAGMDAEHWYATLEVPCPNCHAWQALLVVYYPSAGRLFAIRGSYGWDS